MFFSPPRACKRHAHCPALFVALYREIQIPWLQGTVHVQKEVWSPISSFDLSSKNLLQSPESGFCCATARRSVKKYNFYSTCSCVFCFSCFVLSYLLKAACICYVCKDFFCSDLMLLWYWFSLCSRGGAEKSFHNVRKPFDIVTSGLFEAFTVDNISVVLMFYTRMTDYFISFFKIRLDQLITPR